MTVRHPFLFVAGVAALDFLNTEIISEGEPRDLLQTHADLIRWLGEARVIDRRTADSLGQLSRARAERLLSEVKHLRVAARSLVERLQDGAALRPADLRTINEILGRHQGSLRLDREEKGFRLRLGFQENAGRDSLFLLARTFAEFLSTSDLSLIRRCAGSHCVLTFYDTTKSHTRRWCSMAGCGNRMKAALHYQRSRGR